MGHKIQITPGFCILWALLLLLLPLELILATVAAASFHELCHGLVIRITGSRVIGMIVGAGGMTMETAPMEPRQELLCALAGPVGSFLLVLLYRQVPLLAACAFVQGCFNLLPLYPLDGGRAAACILQMADRAHWMKAIELLTLTVLLILAVWMGKTAVIAWGIVAMRKIPCKDGRFGVQ